MLQAVCGGSNKGVQQCYKGCLAAVTKEYSSVTSGMAAVTKEYSSVTRGVTAVTKECDGSVACSSVTRGVWRQ